MLMAPTKVSIIQQARTPPVPINKSIAASNFRAEQVVAEDSVLRIIYSPPQKNGIVMKDGNARDKTCFTLELLKDSGVVKKMKVSIGFRGSIQLVGYWSKSDHAIILCTTAG